MLPPVYRLTYEYKLEYRGDIPAHTFGAVYRYECSGCGRRFSDEWCTRCGTDESTYETSHSDWGTFTAVRRYRTTKKRAA